MRVLKFGGTSMATEESREYVMEKIRRQYEGDHDLVVVVSAMGRQGMPYATDTLLEMAGTHLSPANRDLLMSVGEVLSCVMLTNALLAEGLPALALTGGEAGIITDECFNEARVKTVDPDRIYTVWRAGQIPVVAGFQGRSERYAVTTLGRGGSDTSAVLFGKALNCEVDIYTDVPGVFTADPRIIPDARILAQVDYQEVLEMAQAGAKVIHPHAVLLARDAQIPLRIRSTFDNAPGTIIQNSPLPNRSSALQSVTGIAHSEGLVGVHAVGKNPRELSQMLDRISGGGIPIDMINFFGSEIYFVVAVKFRGELVSILSETPVKSRLIEPVAKITVVGGDISKWPGVMSQMAQAFVDADIAISWTSDSDYTISLLVASNDAMKGLQVLHQLFNLEAIGVQT